MKRDCFLCKLTEEEQAKLWHLFYVQQPLPFPNTREVKTHFSLHRVKQPPLEKPLSGKDSLKLSEALPRRLRSIILVLKNNPGLSLEQISSLLYLKENPKAALKSASRDLRRLMQSYHLHRVFLEDVPGDGPRPRHDIPALYFLGANSRSYISKITGQSPVKKEEWISSEKDLESWNLWHHLYLSREIPKDIFSQLDLVKEERGGSFTDWEISANFQNWFSPLHFPIRDPLGRFRRIQSDGVFALSFKETEGARSSLLPIFYYLDRGTKTPERIKDMLLAHSALPRSRSIDTVFPSLSQKTIAPVLCVTETPERRDIILQALRGSYPELSLLVASRDALKKPLDAQAWLDLKKNPSSILRSSLLVAGSSGAKGGSFLQEKATL